MSRHLARAGVMGLLAVAVGWMVSGCERKDGSATSTPGAHPDSGSVATTQAANDGTNVGGGTVRSPKGADQEDAPEAPRALPQSHELRGWIKSEPVRMFAAGELGSVISDSAKRAALSTFRLKRVAQCAYQREDTTASVLFVEAATPEDAFGVFSIMTSQPGKLRADGTIRATEQTGEATVVSGWQGETFGQIRCTGPEGKTLPAEECDGLLAKILFNVPFAEPPWLFRAIQSEKREAIKVWVVRSTAALAAAHQRVFDKIDSRVMDERLGLKGGELLAVAAVKAEPGEPANMIWLVRYERPADAQSAADRYQKALESGGGDLDGNTILDDPKGPFLAGSWTAGEESIQKLLHVLRANLPE